MHERSDHGACSVAEKNVDGTALLGWCAFGMLVVSLFYICAFKIISTDFWWDVKAGELIVRNLSLPSVDPFAYTRAGLPYRSIHEWLAQVVLFLVYRTGGVNGAIVFRTLMALVTACALLVIDRRSFWPNALIVIVAFYLLRPQLVERPQLFTFALLGTYLFLASHYLRTPRQEIGKVTRRRIVLFSGVIVLQILWVNLHGAAGLLGGFVIGAVIAQRFYEWWRDGYPAALSRELRFLVFLFAAAMLASLLTPNTVTTFTDLYTFSHDATVQMNAEWQPMALDTYLWTVAPFGITALLSLAAVRKQWVFSLVLLLPLGWLSMHVFRHCFPFVIASLAILFIQLRDYRPYQTLLAHGWHRPVAAIIITCSLLATLAFFAYRHDLTQIIRSGYFGYGEMSDAAGAEDFVEREQLTGKMFNDYNIGSYLLFRGYPSRKVFIDIRSVEFGYAFLRQTLDAGRDPAVFADLDRRYGFSYAVLQIKPAPGASSLPYASHLSANPHWFLVYLDDTSAVYAKDTAANRSVIKNFAYHLITPDRVVFDRAFREVPAKQWPALEQEFRRLILQNTRSVNGRLALGRHLVAENNMEEAGQLAENAKEAQPYNPEIYELLGMVAVAREDWAEALDNLEWAIHINGNDASVNYDYLAIVAEHAGDAGKAAAYHQKALDLAAARQRQL